MAKTYKGISEHDFVTSNHIYISTIFLVDIFLFMIDRLAISVSFFLVALTSPTRFCVKATIKNFFPNQVNFFSPLPFFTSLVHTQSPSSTFSSHLYSYSTNIQYQ